MEATARTSRHPEDNKKKRQIRNFLLDRRFQFRWAFRVVIATSLISVIMGYFLYRTVGDATDQITLQKLGDPNLTRAAVDAFIEQAEQDKWVTLGTLIAGLFSFVLLIGGLSVIYTHKIAGPVYKIRRLLNSIDGYNLQLWAKLRRDDELQQVFVDIDSMLRRIRQNRRSDLEVLEEVRKSYAEKESDKSKLETLDKLIEMYKKSVEMK
jgi:hypothetical protein